MNSSRRRIGLSRNQKSKTRLHANSEPFSESVWGDTELLHNVDLSGLDAQKEVNKLKTPFKIPSFKRKTPEPAPSTSSNIPAKKPKLTERNSDPFGFKSDFESSKVRMNALNGNSSRSLGNLDSCFDESFTIPPFPVNPVVTPVVNPIASTSTAAATSTVPSVPKKAPIKKEEEIEEVFSSQRFIEEIQQIPTTDWMKPKQTLPHDVNVIVTENEEICSQYIELPREDPKNDSLDDLFIDLDYENQNSLNENIDSLEHSQLEPEKDELNTTAIKVYDWESDDFSILKQDAPVGDSTKTPVSSRTPRNSRVQKLKTQKTPLAVSNPVTIQDTPKRVEMSESAKELMRALCPSQPMTPHERFMKNQKLRPVSSSKFSDIGPFFGLPLKVKNLIKECKGIESLYDWQEECLNLKAVRQRNNLIYALPTSGGKSLVSEILMIREILLRKKNVLLVLPYVSLVQEKIADITPFALELGYLVEEYAAGKGSIPPIHRRNKNSIFISTIEKSMILFDSLHEVNREDEIGLIVVDELHMIGDPHRGYVLETLLTKAMHVMRSVQIVGMSATIANLTEIAMFLKADVYTKEFRPIELKEYVKFGRDLMEVKSKKELIKDAFVLARSMDVSYDHKMNQRDPDHLMALVYEVIPKEACLVFCPTKQNCESVALLLAELLPKELREHRRDEKLELMNAIKADSGGSLCGVLTKTLPYGIAYHHSGLTAEERKHIEDAYRLGIICALCCTSTLAAGVNLPAKRVIIRSPYTGSEFLTMSRYKQMIGRAGRAGHATAGESIMICGPKDNTKLAKLFCSPMDEVISGFLTDTSRKSLETVVMNCVENGVAKNLFNLFLFFESTLLGIQSQRFQVDTRELVVKAFKGLFKNGAIAVQLNDDVIYDPEQILQISQSTEKKLQLNHWDHLSVNQLGKGAVKAGLSLESANELYQHLQTVQKTFDLSNYLHLMYLVTPDAAIRPNFNIYHDAIMRLEPPLLHTAELIGVSELNAMQMLTRPHFKGAKKLIIERFYTTLILFDLWNLKEVHEVSSKFRVNRGIIQKLMFAAASNSASILRFCEEMEEFWAFRELLTKFTKRLTYCCTSELLPLMELPGVKIGRAKLLYQAGFQTVEDIANSTSRNIVESVKNISYKQASSMIQSAKLSLVEKIDMYKDKVEEMMKIVSGN